MPRLTHSSTFKKNVKLKRKNLEPNEITVKARVTYIFFIFFQHSSLKVVDDGFKVFSPLANTHDYNNNDDDNDDDDYDDDEKVNKHLCVRNA